MTQSSFVLVLTTLPADSDRQAFAQTLVSERLAACVNILPEMQSTYRWHGNVEEASEHQVLIKTSRERLAQVEARVRALHPYDVPEFVVLPIDGADAYLNWIAASTTAAGSDDHIGD